MEERFSFVKKNVNCSPNCIDVSCESEMEKHCFYINRMKNHQTNIRN